MIKLFYFYFLNKIYLTLKIKVVGNHNSMMMKNFNKKFKVKLKIQAIIIWKIINILIKIFINNSNNYNSKMIY